MVLPRYIGSCVRDVLQLFIVTQFLAWLRCQCSIQYIAYRSIAAQISASVCASNYLCPVPMFRF